MSKQFWVSGILLGLGMGGFFDGIVFHQLLQWHHLICSTDTCTPTSVADLQKKDFADGLFHAGCWVLSVIGLVVLAWSPRIERSGWTLIGLLVAGWGVFNVVEGVVNHLILQVHHVRPGEDQGLWDVAFLVWGALFSVGGTALVRLRRERAPSVEIS